MSSIAIHCKTCDTPFSKPLAILTKYYGETTLLSCPKCSAKTKATINVDFFKNGLPKKAIPMEEQKLTVPFTCTSCLSELRLKKSQKWFSENLNKTRKIQCSRCSNRVSLKIDAELMNASKRSKPDVPSGTQVFDTPKGSSESAKIAKLIVLSSGKHTQQAFSLHEGVQTIGRGGHADHVIRTEDNTISRVHFTLRVQKEGNGYAYFVEDNNSTNGTYVAQSSEPLERYFEREIEAPGIIRVGSAILKLEA